MFEAAFGLARRFWLDLGRDDWPDWYFDSELKRLLAPLNERAWALNREKDVLEYWVSYARKFPERLV